MDRFASMALFLAVVEAGSFSAAGRRVGASLPAVSRRIGDLERRLGAQLFIRTNRRVEPTEAGRAFAMAARRLLDELEAAEQSAAGEFQSVRGELSLTAPTAFGEMHLAPVAAEFLAAHPGVDLRLTLTDTMVDLVEARAHLALRIGALGDSGLVARRVGVTRSITCASPAYLGRRGLPERPEDLTAHDGIVFKGFSAFQWRYLRGASTVVAEPRARVAVNSAAAAIEAGIAGVGVVRALDYQVAGALRRGDLIAVLEAHEVAPLPINLVYPPQARLPLKVRSFLDWAAPRLKTRLSALPVGAPPSNPPLAR